MSHEKRRNDRRDGESDRDLSPRLARVRLGDDDVRRIELLASLPCGMPGCAQPTSKALVEPDPELAGLWMLLPLCDDCTNATRAAAAWCFPGLSIELPRGPSTLF